MKKIALFSAGLMAGIILTLIVLLIFSSISEQIRLRAFRDKGEYTGQLLRDFELKSLDDGKVWRLKNLKGKVSLIKIWSPDCEGCMVEMERLNELYNSTSRDKLIILGLPISHDQKILEDTISQYQIHWPQLYTPDPYNNELIRFLNTYQVPSYWIVDKTGVIIDADLKIFDEVEKSLGFLLN